MWWISDFYIGLKHSAMFEDAHFEPRLNFLFCKIFVMNKYLCFTLLWLVAFGHSFSQSITNFGYPPLAYTKVLGPNERQDGNFVYLNKGNGTLTIGLEVQVNNLATWGFHHIRVKFNNNWHSWFTLQLDGSEHGASGSVTDNYNPGLFLINPSTYRTTTNGCPITISYRANNTSGSVGMCNSGDPILNRHYNGNFNYSIGSTTRIGPNDNDAFGIQTVPYYNSDYRAYPVSDPEQSSGVQAVPNGYLHNHANRRRGNLMGVASAEDSPNRAVVIFTIANLPHEMLESNGFRVHVYSDANTNHDRVYEWVYPPQNFMNNAPLSLTTSEKCNGVELNWANASNTLPTDGVMNVKTAIFRNGSFLAMVPGTTTTYTDLTAAINVEYDYTLKHLAWTEINKTYWPSPSTAIVKGKRKPSPDQPINPTASKNSCDGNITVGWSFNGANPDKFRVDVSTSETTGFTTLTNTLAGSARSYVHSGATRGTKYYYRIYAISSCGDLSLTYASTDGISISEPAIATNVVANWSVTNQRVEVQWKDNANNETAYQLIRQDDLGNTVFFDINKNDTSYADDGVSTCRVYQYKVKVFNECVTAGLISTSQDTAIIPPPSLNNTWNGTTNKVNASKGYFGNRIEISWNAANAQNMDQMKIYRKVMGSSDSVLITSVNPSSSFYVDQTADARVFYEYILRGEKNCNGTILYSNLTRDVGFRNPLGLISGQINYTGNIAVKGARLKAEPASGSSGFSLKFTGGKAQTAQKPSLTVGAELRIDTWIKPINHTDGPVLEKAGAYSIKNDGTNYVVSVTTNSATYNINIPETQLPINSWRQVSLQYNGSNMFVQVNGAQVGSIAATGIVKDTTTALIIGGGANHFFFDEFRLMGKAADSLTAARDYGRFLNGNETGFKVSLHNDEGVGQFAYDVSRVGNNFNDNHFALSGSYAWDSDRPSNAELSYAAYTDSLGNYIISGIQYNGFGDNYTLVPSIGVHQFSPSSRSLYIGDQSQVFNNQDFTDISSFVVTGTIRYSVPGDTNVTCYVKGATIKIDGQPVIKNGQPVLSNNDGFFQIQVPIGLHHVSVEMFEHNFEQDRFPSSGEYDFQAPVSGIAFTDTTYRVVVGRVVGGAVEATKPHGLGRSKNNIGVAKIRFNTPIAGQACYSKTVTTDPITGEYRVKLPPLQYKVDTVFVVSNINAINPSSLSNGNATLNLSTFSQPISVVDTLRDSNGGVLSIDSTSFTKELSFVFRREPTINFLDTLGNKFIGEKFLKYGGDSIPLPASATSWGPFGWPVFRQGRRYHGDAHAYEIYTNNDNGAVDTVRINGTVIFTNEMINGTDPNGQVPMVKGKARYSFIAGDPNNATQTPSDFDYTSQLQMTVVPDGRPSKNWEPNASYSNKVYRGYIIGSKITGTGVATLGPERVDYILRDPAGSGSFATWTTGTSTTKQHSFSAKTAGSLATSAEIKIGFEQSVGFGVQIPVQVEATSSLGMSISASATLGGGFLESITTTSSVSTRDDPDNVGAEADIFIGRSRNWLVGPTSNIELIDAAACSNGATGCFGATVNGKRLAKKLGYAIQPAAVKTRFSYTQKEIEEVVIPTLESLRATKLVAPLYINVLPSSDPRYGANNDDPIFGSSVSTSTPFVYESEDTTGLSYTFTGGNGDYDSVRILNQQIALWKQALARNEREKWKAINNQGGVLIDNFTLGSAIVSNTYEVNTEESFQMDWELALSIEQKLEVGASAAGTGAKISRSLSLSETVGGSHGFTNTASTAFQYTLTDGDPGDIFSIDVYKSAEGTGNIFVTRGGRSMCPYEDAVKPHYFDPANPNAPITSHTYVANPTATIQLATVQREIPNISITPASQFNIPSDQSANFQLVLSNQSPEVVNNDVEMRVRVASQSNPNGAIIKIDGLDPNTFYTIPSGASVVKTLTVERGPIFVDYDSLMIIFSSACSEDIADTAYISVHFIPSCTELALVNPTNNWILNNSNANNLQVKMGNYNYNYGAATYQNSNGDTLLLGLNKIGFEMKPSNSGIWLEIEKFLKYPEMNDSVIPQNDIVTTYPWNVSQIPDGNYELRAKSYCLSVDGQLYSKISPVFAGIMDRINPHPFGTPSPADGVLDPNDDIAIQFNEPLDLGSISWSNFQVRGILNGSSLRHSEFVTFDGVDDHIVVNGGVGLQKKSFTLEFWSKFAPNGNNQTIASQGIDPNENMQLYFTGGGNLAFTLNGETVTSNNAVGSPNTWNHYAVVYNYEDNEAYLYQNGNLLNSGAINLTANYNGSQKLYFGKKVPQNTDYFAGQLHEVRVWNTKRTANQLSQNKDKKLGLEAQGLVHNWNMDEATGVEIRDAIRERTALMQGASWQVEPVGYAGEFNGTTSSLMVESGSIPVTKEMDFTLEFWFNSNQSNAATMFSSGKGDGIGGDSLTGWDIAKDASGKIHAYHKGLDFVATDSNYFDGNWHHFALVVDRNANISAYVDGALQNSVQSTGLGALSSAKYSVGARGFFVSGGAYNQDKFFTGKLDEIRLWNTARKVEQIKRDRNIRLKGDEFGLYIHVPFERYTENVGVQVLVDSTFNTVSTFPLATVAVQGGFLTSNQTPVMKLPRPVEAVNFTWSLNNDKIIITPTTAPELLENQTIDITVKNLFDKQGNKMESPKTWIAYFNKNQVYWANSNLEYSIGLDSALQFTATILNTGGSSKAFNLTGLPTWLSANITSGTIAPNSQMNVQFSVNPGLNVGEFYADIALLTDFNYKELLRVSLKVNGTPPNWNLNPNNFQFSMAVVGQIKLDGVLNGNPETKIAGFMNDTLVALGNLQYVPAYDRYVTFLNLYSNYEFGDSIRFSVYDANTGNVYVEVNPNIYFVDGDVLGTASNPVTFEASLVLDRPIPLNAGWTWISLPLADADQINSNALFDGINVANGNVVKGQTVYDQYDTTSGWIGSITANGGYANVRSYKVRLSQLDTLHNIGTRIHPDSTTSTIHLVPGYNWIGFMSTKNLPLAVALGNYNAHDGDLIKSQYEFAYYDSIAGSWLGSLSAMKPGLGYVLKTNQAGSFNYPLAAFLRSADPVAPLPEPYYDFRPELYAKNMSVTVASNFCPDNYPNYTPLLGAFDAFSQLKGYAAPVYDEVENRWTYYLTVHGDMQEDLQLKFFLNENGQIIPSEKHLTFQEDALAGTKRNPVFAAVHPSHVCNEILDDQFATWTVDPNPFVEEFELTFDQETSGTVMVMDMSGKILFERKINDVRNMRIHSNTWNEKLSQGVYMIQVMYEDGTIEQKRIVKLKN